jgi:mono/diheme cytochrome c family protein
VDHQQQGRSIVKILGKVVLAALVVVLLAAGGLYGKASWQAAKVRDIALRPLNVASDSATIARGRHLASAILKCTDCHGDDLGGREPFTDAGPLGVVNSANLTQGAGGVIGKYDDAACMAVPPVSAPETIRRPLAGDA